MHTAAIRFSLCSVKVFSSGNRSGTGDWESFNRASRSQQNMYLLQCRWNEGRNQAFRRDNSSAREVGP